MSIKTFSVNLLILVYFWALFRDIFVECVRITGMSPTQYLERDSIGSVILDCQFEMDEHRDTMTVLKWYHRGDPTSIYQWIISKGNRKYSDKIEPFVDKNFSIGDKSTKFRAIRLINPPISLRGIYECSVQSLDSHDSRTTELIIYETAKTFTMNAIEVDNGVNITCEGTGLSPEPKLTLFRITQSNESNSINAIEVRDKIMTSVSREQSGQYNVSLTTQVYEDSYSPSIDVTDHYECRLMIEKTDYMETRNLAIQSGWHTRHHSHNSSPNNPMARMVQTLVGVPLLAMINIMITGCLV